MVLAKVLKIIITHCVKDMTRGGRERWLKQFAELFDADVSIAQNGAQGTRGGHRGLCERERRDE
jgi:hypothetical protein